jgi:hypothetical protein
MDVWTIPEYHEHGGHSGRAGQDRGMAEPHEADASGRWMMHSRGWSWREGENFRALGSSIEPELSARRARATLVMFAHLHFITRNHTNSA